MVPLEHAGRLRLGDRLMKGVDKKHYILRQKSNGDR